MTDVPSNKPQPPRKPLPSKGGHPSSTSHLRPIQVRPSTTPPRGTPHVSRPASTGSLRPVTVRPPLGSHKTPATSRATIPVQDGPEVIVSESDLDESRVRHQISAVVAPASGMSLKWKIVVGMSSITIATAVLIFFFVYQKAVAQLNDEINAKGLRLTQTLASIDSQYWSYAMHQSTKDREERLDTLLERLFAPVWTVVSKDEVFRRKPDVREKYEHMGGLLGGDKRKAVAKAMHESMLNAYMDVIPKDSDQALIRKHYEETLADPTWQGEFDRLVDPIGTELNPLRQGAPEVGPEADIYNITVIDSQGAGVAAVETKSSDEVVYYPSSQQKLRNVLVMDGKLKSLNKPVRLFKLDHEITPANKLQFNVILSLQHIEDARRALRTAIFLPILVSVFLSIGVAIWISTLITEPIKILMRDIQHVSHGDLNHQTTATSRDEIGLLANTFNRMTVALRAAHAHELEAKALEHDMAIASEIQMNLVPKQMLQVPGFDVAAYYRPSKEVGGDYYDFIDIDDDNVGIIVADVSGKGVPGSLVMSMARAFIRMEAERSRNTSPADTLMRANRMLAKDIKKGMFVTAVYCILHKKSGEIRMSSAGHNPLLVCRSGGQMDRLNPGGIALGFDKGPIFDRSIKEESFVLNRGDRMMAYTDGVVEAMNAAQEEFSDERFQRMVMELTAQESNRLLVSVVQALDAHRGAAPQSDDITIVTLRHT